MLNFGHGSPWFPDDAPGISAGIPPMTRHAHDTLSTCGGLMGLRVRSVATLVSRTVLPSEERSFCGAVRVIPIFRLRLALSCNRVILRCPHGSGQLTW
jgi:hypothetical protein